MPDCELNEPEAGTPEAGDDPEAKMRRLATGSDAIAASIVLIALIRVSLAVYSLFSRRFGGSKGSPSKF
jgi:hypothetical protein